MNVAPYRKAIVAIGAVVALIVAAVADGTVTGQEIGEIVGGAFAAFGVWAVRNEDTQV